MYKLFRPSALSMDMIFTFVLFIFCTRKMYQSKELNARFKLAMHLETLVSTYYTSSHCTLYYSFRTLRRFCVDILAQAFLASYLARHRPSPSGDGYLLLLCLLRVEHSFSFSYSFLYREGSSSLDPVLEKVPRSLRGDVLWTCQLNEYLLAQLLWRQSLQLSILVYKLFPKL